MDRRAFLTTAVGAAALAVAPGPVVAAPGPSAAVAHPRPRYSNLADRASRVRVRHLLDRAGVWTRRTDVLLRHVDQINAIVPKGQLATGLVPIVGTQRLYDPYDLQDRWDARHPEFVGYNCRITAFGLYDEFVRIGLGRRVGTDRLFLDLEAMDSDRSVRVTRHFADRFTHFYGRLPTVASTDPRRHLEVLRRTWRRRGIRFVDNPRIRLISVVQHDQLDSDELFVGHTGVLLPHPGGLWFLEKLAFQEPYRLCRFRTRRELSDYLMRFYDIDRTGTTAPPLVMENDQLIAGYRVLR